MFVVAERFVGWTPTMRLRISRSVSMVPRPGVKKASGSSGHKSKMRPHVAVFL